MIIIEFQVRLSEQRRQENLALQARLGVLESKSRELLVHQGSSVSGASVALSALIGRLDGLVEELVVAYSISDQELEVSFRKINKMSGNLALSQRDLVQNFIPVIPQWTDH